MLHVRENHARRFDRRISTLHEGVVPARSANRLVLAGFVVDLSDSEVEAVPGHALSARGM
jgi:hypothetical protein